MDKDLCISEIRKNLDERDDFTDDMCLTIKEPWIIPIPRKFIHILNQHSIVPIPNENINNLDIKIKNNI